MDSIAQKYCKYAEQVKGSKTNFETYWQTLHDYFYVEAANITSTDSAGSELNFDGLYDTFSLEAANVFAAGITNYLTPPMGKWFNLRTKDPNRMESKAVKIWLKDTEAELYHMLNNSNFYDQITPFFKTSGVFGTAVLLAESDERDGVRFSNIDLACAGIVNDSRGRVSEYYLEFQFTAVQAVSKWGFKAVGDTIQECYTTGRDANKTFDFLLVISERIDRNVTKKDSENMPIMALWIDKSDKKVVEESGYRVMPAFTHRFYTRGYTPWGYSPAMDALPDVRWLNAIAKTELQSTMKQADPAWALPNDSFVLPLDLNPNALNYYDSRNFNKDSIFPLSGFGNAKINEYMIEKKYNAIKSHLFYDVFKAFEGITKQMTVIEVQKRISEQMVFLGPAVGRWNNDVLNGVIDRLIDICYETGKLPELPQELMADPRYEVEYTSVLALAQKQSDMQSLTTALGLAGEIAQFNPSVLDKVNTDKAIDSIWGITGADVSVLYDQKEVDELRQYRAQQQQEQEQRMAIAEGAQIAKTASEAEKNMSQSKSESA